MWNHVESCEEYKALALRDDVHKSFRFSEDKDLIRAYKEGHAKTVRFECPFCGDTYSFTKRLIGHLAGEHSGPLEILEVDEKETFRRRVEERIPNRMKPGPFVEPPPESIEEEGAPPGGVQGPPISEPRVPTRTPEGPGGTVSPPRGGEHPGKPPTGADLSIGDECSSILSEQEIQGEYCEVPSRLRGALGQTEQVAMVSRGTTEETLQYDWRKARLLGLGTWFRENATEPGDKIVLQLLARSPARIRLWTNWQKNLEYLLACPLEDKEWEYIVIRDCLLLVLARLKEPVDYRTLYAEISRHRHLKASSVIACLSRHKGILFMMTDRGKWGLMRDDIHETLNGQGPSIPRTGKEVSTELGKDWLKTIEADIIEYDLVYKMLERSRQDMSYNQMCQRLAKSYSIDWHKLSHTQFFNPRDPRLKRLDNGNWTLQKWFTAPTPSPLPPEPAPGPEQDARSDGADEERKHNLIRKVWSYLKRVLIAMLSKTRGVRG